MARSDSEMPGKMVTLVLTAGLLWPAALVAETVYKTIDASGNVTYSNTPPAPGADVQEVTIPPAPKAEEIRSMLENRQELEQAGARLEKELEAQKSYDRQRLQIAEQAVLQARIRWEQAIAQRDADWQYLQSEGRYLRGDYLQRVQEAEEALRAAEAALAIIRRQLH